MIAGTGGAITIWRRRIKHAHEEGQVSVKLDILISNQDGISAKVDVLVVDVAETKTWGRLTSEAVDRLTTRLDEHLDRIAGD